MAELNGIGQDREPAPHVSADPTLRTGAGTPVQARVMITNRAAQPRVMALTAMGADANWLPRPGRSRVVAPGETILAELTFSPATGTLPARYPVAIAVQALDPRTEQALSSTTLAEIQLIVDAPGQIDIGLSPADTTTVFGKRITVDLRNSGPAPVSVRLDVQATSSTPVHLAHTELNLQAGEARRVRGRVRVKRVRLFGHRARHTYSVTARSSSAPRHVEGSVTARAMLGPGGTKLAVLATVLAVWVALALVFIPKLADSIKNKHTITAQSAQTSSASPTGDASTSSGSGSGGGSGAGGSGGSGGAGSGSGGAAAGAKAAAVQLTGTITGSAPGGVTVGIKPTSLADQDVQGATGVGVDTGSVTALGKIPATALLTTAPSTVSESRSTTTSKDGAWSFASVRSPGYYLLTFAKNGYQTERYVVNAASGAASKPLQVALVPGRGRLTGMVRGPHGPVGGAQITITDGTNTITTSSNTKGRIGAWSVDGLSTPSSYVVRASKDGLGAESALVDLAAGGHSSVSLRLKTGVASLVGQVQATNSLGAFGGLGGATVTVTNGTITRSATTITTQPVGYYTLPDLPAPGKYSVTISAAGYLPQTQSVSLKKGQSTSRVGAVLTTATASISGSVTGDVLDQDGARTGAVEPEVDAGLTLKSAAETYKITTTSRGTFRFTGIAPGSYVLAAEYAGLQTQYRRVVVAAGDDISVKAFYLPRASQESDSTIAGYVGSAVSPSGTVTCAGACIHLSLTDSDGTVPISSTRTGAPKASVSVSPSSSGPTGYTLYGARGLAPGLYHLTVSADGYLVARVSVQVPLDAVAQAPQVNLYPSDTITGTLSALSDSLTDLSHDGNGKQYTNCVVVVPVDNDHASTTPATCDGAALDRLYGTSTCLTTGKVGPAHGTVTTDETSLASQYTIKNLCDGTYRVYVVITNPDYVSPGPTAIETVVHGQTVNYSPQVFRKGRVRVSLFQVGSDNSTTPVTNWTGSVSCTANGLSSDVMPVPNPHQKGPASQIVVTGVPAGRATCSAIGTSASGRTTGISVGNNNDTGADITVAASVDPVTVHLVSDHGTAADPQTVVAGASVTLSGVTGYDGTTPTTNDAAITSGPNGCAAVTADGANPPHPVSPCSSFDAGSVGTLNLVAPRVTVTADAPGYLPYAGSVNVAGGGVQTVTLLPEPSAVTTTLTTTDGSMPSAATITVTKLDAPGSGSISAKVGDGGAIVWTDSRYTALDGAWPGTYTVRASLAGYQDATITLTCAFTKPCTASPASFQLKQLGSLTGAVGGVLQGEPSPAPDLGALPSQGPVLPLVGATVTATYCDDQSSASSSTCTTSADSRSTSVTTGLNGSYSITGISGHTGLTLGWWKIEVTKDGYASGTKNIEIRPGVSQQGAYYLYAETTSVSIGVLITAPPPKTPTADDLSTAAIVTVTRLDTYASTTVTTATNDADGLPLYVFADMVPTTYRVDITGPSLSTSTVISVSYSATAPPPIFIEAGGVQHSVSGIVTAPQGGSSTVSGLNGVTVELGTLKGSGATQQFVVAPDGAGNNLHTTTKSSGGQDGTYSFPNVPIGNYYARYQYLDPDTHQPIDYVSHTTRDQFTVYDDLQTPLDTVQLKQVTHNVTVTLTSTSTEDSGNADDLSGTELTLTYGSGTVGATGSPYQAPKDSGASVSTTFTAVPFGTWTLSITLPSGHFGTITTGSATCTTTTSAPVQRKCADTITVPGDPDDLDTPVTATYTLDEGEISATVNATPLAPDTAPTVAEVSVSNADADTVYDNSEFPVAEAASFWVPTGTYTIEAKPADSTTYPSTAWPSDSTSVTVSTASAQSPTLTLTEKGASLTVDAAGSSANKAAVTITCTQSQTQPSDCATKGWTKNDSGNGAAFTDLAPGSWTVAVTLGGITTTRNITLVAGKSGDDGDGKTLPVWASVTVKVVSGSKPVNGAELTFAPQGDQSIPADVKTATTNPEGEFTVTDLPAGSWKITATSDEKSDSATKTLAVGANKDIELTPK